MEAVVEDKMSSVSQDLTTRLRFLEIDDGVKDVLRKVWPVIKPELPSVLKGFYGHMVGFPEMAAKVGTQQSRLEGVQSLHWSRLLQAQFDEGYVDSVRRIGMAHVRINLAPQWYMGGYMFVLGRLADIIGRSNRFSGPAAARSMAAVQRAVMLDMDLAISVYQDSLLDQVRQRQEKIESAVAAFDKVFRQGLDQVTSASSALGNTARDMSELAMDAQTRTENVARSAESTQMEVKSGAAATEEVSASIAEISQQTTRSLTVAQQAVADADRTNQSVKRLAATAETIESIVSLISKIAEQTNLLALNATIEAARAGEAGKGFAVVASEVKALASQTAKATDEISRQIEAIQEATRQAVNDIDGIGKTISEVSTIATMVASAVEEQGAATREIASTVQKAAMNSEEVAQSVDVLRDTAVRTGHASADVLGKADDLAKRAEGLRTEFSAFIKDVLAA